MSKKPHIADIEVVTDGEAELADFVVCVRLGHPTPFKDNLEGKCCKCGHKVVFRPHAPKTPKRICMECATSNFTDEDWYVATTQAQQEALKKIKEH